MSTSTLDRVLAGLTGVRQEGSAYMACCPAHEDRRQSLSVAQGDDGRVLLHCHAGCSTLDVVEKLGLRVADLFSHSENHRATMVATYDYVDEKAQLLYQSVRFDPKRFAQRRPLPGGRWKWSLGEVRLVLYRLPEVLAATSATRTVFVVEGEKDADTLAARGLVATTNAMGAGKWRPDYSECLRNAHVVLLPDNDDAGREHMRQVARSLEGIATDVILVDLPGLPPKGDVSDWVAAGGTPAELERLTREERLRAASGCEGLPERRGLADPDITSSEPVDLAALLDDLAEYLRRYIVFPMPQQADAVALWIAHTFVYELFDTSPYLAVTSPEKRCGKSRVFEVLELVVRDPWRAVTPSAAVVHRKIDWDRPTLLLDETDAVFGATGRQTSETSEALRAIINAGNRRGATVDRCAGPSHDRLDTFNIFSPKAFAGIGAALPDTVTDRSIVIRMARKAPGESCERFRERKVRPIGHELRDRLRRWATAVELSEEPELPDELDDRAQDSWEALLAIADAAGGSWPEKARRTALVLSAGRTDLAESLGVRLLADIRAVFNAGVVDKIWTVDLIARLSELDESPWATLHNGQRITANRLAALLRPYGIRPHELRIAAKTTKGYESGDFDDTWTRYLPSLKARAAESEGQQRQHACIPRQNEGQQASRLAPGVADEKLPHCGDVAHVAAQSCLVDNESSYESQVVEI